MSAKSVLAVLVVLWLTVERALAGEPALDVLDVTAVRSAIDRSIPLLERGSAGSAEQRACFTCHSQALPVFALAEARQRGFRVDEENLTRQIRHTIEHLRRGREGYLNGRGQGGRVLTAGYALWTLEAGDWQPDETTAAVTSFLLQYQSDKNHWEHQGSRPPSSGSDFTATYVALRALNDFATEQQRPQVSARTQVVGKWLLETKPTDTEDRVFRLRSLPYVSDHEDAIQEAAAELLNSQLKDGGWSQTDGAHSDAYATATVLAALLRDGHVSKDHTAIRRGIRYLLDTQLPDGSWHVTTRAKPFQTYFESGYPHGKDQFISITAGSWATIALLLTLPESPPEN